MWDRCRNPHRHNAHRYAEKGITVCERWKSFENFLTDMGPRPEGLSLDRIDNEKGYSPDNCQWADASQQSKNRKQHLSHKKRAGQKYNNLTFLHFTRSTKDTAYWMARCDCGNELEVSARNVIRNYRKSCGCLGR